MILERLRKETKALHDAIDHSPAMLQITSGTAERYDRQVFVLKQRQWVEGIYRHLLPAVTHDATLREALEERLLTVTESNANLGIAPVLFATDIEANLPSVAGWLYTLEGSLLGAGHINKTLQRIYRDSALAYTHPADKRASWWQNTLDLLGRIPQEGEEAERCTQAAKNAFSCAKEHFVGEMGRNRENSCIIP